MSDQRVRPERVGDVGVIVIDNPPISAGSTAVRRGLLDAIEQVLTAWFNDQPILESDATYVRH